MNRHASNPVSGWWCSLRARTLAAATLALLAAALVACVGTSGQMTVSGAWVRAASATDQPSAAYFSIANGTAVNDTLLGVSTPAAAMAEIHETSVSNGITSMSEIGRIAVPAGGSVALEPGGRHLMLMDLTSPLAAGTKVELDLVFEHAGKIVVLAEVRQG